MITISSYVSPSSFPDIRIDAETLAGFDLSHRNFHRYLFKDFDMTGCSLRSIKGRGSFFKNCVLKNADFTSANIMSSLVDNCVLDGAILRGAILRDLRVRGSSFLEADFTDAKLHGAKLSEARLEGAILAGALYDSRTVWPLDFIPDLWGAILEV